MSERSNTEEHWDEFCDWCEDSDVESPKDGAHEDDWGPWWECWNAALDARDADEAKSDT